MRNSWYTKTNNNNILFENIIKKAFIKLYLSSDSLRYRLGKTQVLCYLGYYFSQQSIETVAYFSRKTKVRITRYAIICYLKSAVLTIYIFAVPYPERKWITAMAFDELRDTRRREARRHQHGPGARTTRRRAIYAKDNYAYNRPVPRIGVRERSE